MKSCLQSRTVLGVHVLWRVCDGEPRAAKHCILPKEPVPYLRSIQVPEGRVVPPAAMTLLKATRSAMLLFKSNQSF